MLLDISVRMRPDFGVLVLFRFSLTQRIAVAGIMRHRIVKGISIVTLIVVVSRPGFLFVGIFS